MTSRLSENFPSKQSINGYTLIELIVVVVVLSVLLIAIIPKFLSLQDDAELATIESTAGSFRSAVKLVQISLRAQGFSTRTQNLPNFGAGNIDTNNIGFPIGIDKGNGNENIGRGNAGCVGVWNGILRDAYSVATNSSVDFQSYRHTGNRVCSYVYRANGDVAGRNSAELVIQYDSRDGQVYVCGQKTLLGCPF
ncbi:prepilin-type N-terminal cleavage/methylation domain-containing protein [Aliikangiella marina]|uniref:Prepilin-type N-terminal cleavage/methylation domain-containing protein n=1 Tax=Aliikangiella marina TaxID=1712262 RepID=A0A545T6D3_9GAMM|nr:prepilin-type N-terminal cleavage/methylation domain-containing protein [Aliikangiella marina]TQV72790.1 prepilin-type N-terminal cleavage/methylation domain-containing protein [Aliikangiella marina]